MGPPSGSWALTSIGTECPSDVDGVEAALGVFAELGYEAATTKAIAAQAGVTQGLVTRRLRRQIVRQGC